MAKFGSTDLETVKALGNGKRHGMSYMVDIKPKPRRRSWRQDEALQTRKGVKGRPGRDQADANSKGE
jgi:hypothetical protein